MADQKIANTMTDGSGAQYYQDDHLVIGHVARFKGGRRRFDAEFWNEGEGCEFLSTRSQ